MLARRAFANVLTRGAGAHMLRGTLWAKTSMMGASFSRAETAVFVPGRESADVDSRGIELP